MWASGSQTGKPRSQGWWAHIGEPERLGLGPGKPPRKVEDRFVPETFGSSETLIERCRDFRIDPPVSAVNERSQNRLGAEANVSEVVQPTCWPLASGDGHCGPGDRSRPMELKRTKQPGGGFSRDSRLEPGQGKAENLGLKGWSQRPEKPPKPTEDHHEDGSLIKSSGVGGHAGSCTTRVQTRNKR